MLNLRPLALGLAPLLLTIGCTSNPASPDGGTDDAGGPDMATWCRWKDVPPTAGAGGTVKAGALTAGAAEVLLDLPVGSALGGYTARSVPLGGVGNLDGRTNEMSGKFYGSIGIETIPKVKAVALAAGGESVVILRADLILANESLTFDVADALGPSFAGKVIAATTHSHSAPAQYSTNTALGVGLGRFRSASYKKLVARAVEAAKAAIAAMRPAKIGVWHDGAFDPKDDVNRDRRDDNDALAGGKRKDRDLFVLRVDGMDGQPIAVVDVFGVHGTVLDADNQLMTTDAPGAIERAVEESFDRPVIAMHLQGAGGDVSPAGHGGVDANFDDAAHYNFARAESVGLYAQPFILDAWTKAGGVMQAETALEMVTRVVPLGPDPKTFSIRGGALTYAPWDPSRACDGKIWDDQKRVLSPIDEFNAPFGAGLCGGGTVAPFPGSQMPGTEKLGPYKACMLVEVAADYLGRLLELPFEPVPVCASTRTVISSLRLGDFVVVTLPGEPVTLLADRVRQLSPQKPERTIVVGYAQGHVGYLLTAEDWLQGGYEPSINLWGPLEGEYLAERAGEVMKLVATDDREDATKGGMQRLVAPDWTDPIPAADPAPMAGQVPQVIPGDVYLRGPAHPMSAQPDPSVPRLKSARFVWIGEDPQAGTPRVLLQRSENGAFVDVARRSGRKVMDADVLLTWTPYPLRRKNGTPRTHYWAAEWQAVAPAGPTVGSLAERAGVALGTYRFHVIGTGYTLDSAPFTVGPAALVVKAQVAQKDVLIDVAYDGAGGFRLLDVETSSSGKVPLRRGPVDVELSLGSGQAQKIAGVTPTAAGRVTVPVPMGETVKGVKVTDRFGNVGTATP